MKTEKAIFAAGCFWHVEQAFKEIHGVIKTSVGYIGGKMKNPTYEDVCSHETGHAEAVLIEYDHDKVSYNELLNVFWKIHDPTQLNRQGFDIGNNYRSAIFYLNEKQKELAMKSKKELEKSKKYKSKITTQITKAKEFYKAEEYHQNYLEKHGLKTCRI